MVKENIIDQYLSSGKKLFPLKKNSKSPLGSSTDWVEKKFDINVIKSHNGNLGWAIDKKYLVIDVDVLKGGKESFEKLISYLQNFDRHYCVEPSTITPSGGLHYYMTLPKSYEDKSLRKNLKEYPGIDFLTYGNYCVIPGSYLNTEDREGYYSFYDDLFDDITETSIPKALLNILVYEKDNQKSELGDFEGIIGGKSANWSLEKINRMLSKLDPDMQHDEWVRVGMGLHNWDPLLGIDIWRDWSKESDKFDENVLQAKWKSFSIGGGISLGTVNHMVKEVEFTEDQEKINAYVERIKFASERSLHFDIVGKIRNENFDTLNREKLVKAIQNRMKEITGVRQSIAIVRQLIQRRDDETGKFVDEEKPKWCKDWLYVNSHNSFLHIPTMRMHKSESFNIENGIYIPFSDGGTKTSATKYVADKGFIQKVDLMGYLPTYEGLICSLEGTTIVNTFNAKTIPITAKEYSKEGLKTIKMFEKHIQFLTGTEENFKIFMQWLAHQVQYPGRQILWAPFIQSIQGVGKSYVGEVMRLVMGDVNVGTVSPSQAVSNFNSWATGKCLNIVEEVKMTGHNRYDAVNSMKPLITDRKIMVNEKGVKQYEAYNVTNYIFFSNHKDAVPMDEDDRRYWIIFVMIGELKEIENIIGVPLKDYFPTLFDMTRQYCEELRKYFLEYEITKEFMMMKQAPLTSYKQMMISTEESNHYGLSELRELIHEGGQLFNKTCISSSDLFDEFCFRHPDIFLDNRQKKQFVKKTGLYNIASSFENRWKNEKDMVETPA